jgi:hypothetical protein
VAVNGSLQGRQQNRRIKLASPEDVNPALVLDLVFIGHLDDAVAEIENVVAQQAGERPSLEVILLDGIIPGVALRWAVTLEDVEQANLARHAMLLKEIQMHQRRTEAVAEGFEGVGIKFSPQANAQLTFTR